MKHRMIGLLAATALLLAGCSATDSGAAGDPGEPIKIGASLPITGSLAAFGELIENGYQAAVDDVNDDGGIEIDGVKHQVELVVRDSTSDPNTVAEQSRELVLNEGVVGLLGSVSPPLTIPASNVAERERVPLVATLTPLQAWKAANPDGWTYAWDLFFDEGVMTDLQFKGSDLVDTNHKVALFTDNEEDGITMGDLWTTKAPELGYEIAYHAEFPVGTTDYSSFIEAAKSTDADILIAQMIPPDAFALWKQMKALNFTPKLAFCEKCGAQGAFQRELGPLAEGTATTDFWTRSENPEAADLVKRFGEQYGENLDLSSVIISYTAAQVLLDAIARAGSTDPETINSAIAETAGEYPIGQEITFDSDNSFAVNPTSVQWRGDTAVPVYSAADGALGEWVVPVAGLTP
tara:strand:+ start:889 stop:2106 length:1218 start_codon:yes stop_codon:yes gene_type:complete